MPGIGGYRCQWPNCGWCFTSTQRRHRHNVQVHGGRLRPPVVLHPWCPWTDCGRRFPTMVMLHQHINGYHEGHLPTEERYGHPTGIRQHGVQREARRLRRIYHADININLIASSQDEARTVARMIIEHSPDEPRVMRGAVHVSITTGRVWRDNEYDYYE